MTALPLTPKLRGVEATFTFDSHLGRALVLRDPQGLAEGGLVVPIGMARALEAMDGTRSSAALARETGLARTELEALIALLDRHGFLDSPAFSQRHAAALADFDAAPLRPARLAGGAYPGEAAALEAYYRERCAPFGPTLTGQGALRGLVAPHIDPWRGAAGYGASYGALAQALAPEVDTFLIFGTSHAPMHTPFSICAKGFDTPHGPLPCDDEGIAELERAARFDPYQDRLNHWQEHSIEFQAVFLRHALGARPVRIIPVLAGLGAFQSERRSPKDDDDVRRFLDAAAELAARRAGRLVVVAGVDLAHIGPRFGDREALDPEGRAQLERTDRQSIELLAQRAREELWQQVTADQETRRVCGLAPLYSLLWALGEGQDGQCVHYEQTLDPEEGSVVSHTGVGFFEPAERVARAER